MTTLTIASLLPGLQNTNGDAENAEVLARRAEWAGLDARVVRVDSRDDLPDRVEPDLARALDDFLASPEPERGVKTIVFTADSMRRTRAHLGLTGAE